MLTRFTLLVPLALVVSVPAPAAEPEKKPDPVMTVDKDKKTITISCKIALRQLPKLTEVYPIEVIATYPHDGDPKGQKAHETVVTFSGVKPSEVHKALESLGLKPGKPARGEEGKAEGPELKIYLEFDDAEGQPKKVAIEKCLVDKKTGQTMPTLKWHFTGSSMKQPNPEKEEKVYAADLTGTLIGLFPVTDETVIQTNLTLKDEPIIKLDIKKTVLPKEGEPAKLIIEVPSK